MRHQTNDASFVIEFHSKNGSISFSVRDVIIGRTTDGQLTDVGDRHISGSWRDINVSR